MLDQLDIVFGHELSEQGLGGLKQLGQLTKLRLIKFLRLVDDSMLLLQPLINLTDLVIQVTLEQLL